MIIAARNLLDVTALNTYITTNYAAGVSTFNVSNINSFNANWAIQLGRTNEEVAEILLLTSSAPSGTTLVTTSTSRFPHPKDTPVYGIKYDKIIFKRSITGTAGTAVAFTGSTVSITPDSVSTEYDDITALDTYAYRACYYNSVSGVVSGDSDWITTSGFSFYSLSKMRSRTKDALYSAGYLKYDNQIDDWINEWVEQMTNSAIKVNQEYSMGTVGYSFGTAGYGTVTATDFKQPRKFEVSYDNGVSYTNSKFEPINRFADSDIVTSLYPKHSWLGDDIFRVRPAQQGGSARITYSKLPLKMQNDTDELPLSLRSHTTGCVEWVLYRAYDNDQKQDYAEAHYSKFRADKEDFVAEITPRDMTGPQTIEFMDSLSGRSDDGDMEFYEF